MEMWHGCWVQMDGSQRMNSSWKLTFTSTPSDLGKLNPPTNRINSPHFMPNKKWNAYKKWEDKSYLFFDRIARAFDPIIFRPNYSGHPIVSVTTVYTRWIHQPTTFSLLTPSFVTISYAILKQLHPLLDKSWTTTGKTYLSLNLWASDPNSRGFHESRMACWNCTAAHPLNGTTPLVGVFSCPP